MKRQKKRSPEIGDLMWFSHPNWPAGLVLITGICGDSNICLVMPLYELEHGYGLDSNGYFESNVAWLKPIDKRGIRCKLTKERNKQ